MAPSSNAAGPRKIPTAIPFPKRRPPGGRPVATSGPTARGSARAGTVARAMSVRRRGVRLQSGLDSADVAGAAHPLLQVAPLAADGGGGAESRGGLAAPV